MKEEIERTITETFSTCLTCGRRYKIRWCIDKEDKCSVCIYKEREAMRQGKLIALNKHMIGAVITRVEFMESDEIESIEVTTSDNRKLKFTAGGYDERYIEWEEGGEE